MITCKTGEVVTDEVSAPEDIPFTWDNANVYFLLTDRFFNGNPNNDFDHSIREAKPAPLRGYMGGDFAGIIQKIEEGYFSELGIHAIWISPVVEQIDGSVDEGTGISFAFHGYWTKDWTALNPMFGNEEELRMLVKTAHEHNIRVLLDVVINHTGPVTEVDPKWPDDWVRTEPTCVYKDAASTINCTLVDNLPDILTENKDQAVSLPPHIIEKWEAEGRLEQEMAELDNFFEETGFPRTPYHHIIKWLVDLIIDYGFDGFRVDTVKHTESYVWLDLWKVAQEAWNFGSNKTLKKL
jgi:alpha-amylase